MCIQGRVQFNDPDYFEEMSKLIIPKGQESDPRYMLTTKAIILFLFIRGEFGRRTPSDSPTYFQNLLNLKRK